MSINPDLFLLLLLMALVTAMTRIGGYLAVARLTLGPRLTRFLETTPKTVFVAMIAVPLWEGGAAEWIGAAIAAGAMKLSGNLAVAIVAGVGTVAVLRTMM